MHILQPTTTSPTHRLKSDQTIVGVLRELPAGVGSNRPAVDPEDYELIPASGEGAKEAAFRAAIAAGYTAEPEGITLGMLPQDLTNWGQLLVMLREAEGLGGINSNSPVQFLDITGTLQTATLTRFREIIVGLGQAYQTAFFAHHA